jgi:DNA-binding NtrC family response regulator
MAQEAVAMDDRNRGHWSPQLSLLEFSGEGHQGDRGWLEGSSETVARVRQRAVAIARTGYSAAVIAGEPGCGKHRVARWLHRHGSRGDRALASVDASAGDAASAVADLAASLRDPSRGDVPGNLVVHNVQRAGAPLIRRLLELLSRQPAPLSCGLLLLTTAPASVLRARSLEHEQLIGRSTSALLEVPPLRGRQDDIPEIARSFLGDAAAHYDRTIRGLSPQALARLQRHAFPGNLRELRLIVEQAVLRGTGDWITLDDLGLPTPEATADADRGELVIRLPGASLREVELQTIRLALRLCDGRLVRAADLLGITRHALRRKLEKYNLDELRQRGPGSDDDPDNDTFI